MTRRSHVVLTLFATLAILVAACNASTPGPLLTDPKAIITAALTSTEAAKSVHLDLSVDGAAIVALPAASASGTPVDLTGTTASADADLAVGAAKANFATSAIIKVSGQVIVVNGKTFVKTTLTGPLYVASGGVAVPGGANPSVVPVDPTKIKSMVDTLGDLLLKQGVDLVKGDDIACGSEQCYTVTADLTAAQLGTTGSAAVAGLPVDLIGATLKLTVRVEKDLPYHLAGIEATLTAPKGTAITADLRASKWDEPVSITAPPPDQVKPAS